MEALLDEISFKGMDLKEKRVKVDAAYVRRKLSSLVQDKDMSRYIL
jgi:ATP-dependent HslUV protease ATP-binding subunit HslU